VKDEQFLVYFALFGTLLSANSEKKRIFGLENPHLIKVMGHGEYKMSKESRN